MSAKPRLNVAPVIPTARGGTRPWPLGRSMHRKQYLSLDVGKGEETLLQQAVRRAPRRSRRAAQSPAGGESQP